MEAVRTWLGEFAENIMRTLSLLSFRDSFISSLVNIIDILFVAVLFYYVFKFIRRRRAGKLALGVAVFLLILAVTQILEMHAAQFLLTNVFQIGLITVIVVFQPELRSALEVLGGETVKVPFKRQRDVSETTAMIDELAETVAELSESKTGALIVIERTTLLGDHIITGTVINADVQRELIKNIFYNKAPMHDGAMIIRDCRIHAAGCLLPLTTRTDLIKDLGMRHRAAIGLSENSDAVVIVCSEETGIVSYVVGGEIMRNFTPTMLKAQLRADLVGDEDDDKKHTIRRTVKSVAGMIKTDKSGKTGKSEKTERTDADGTDDRSDMADKKADRK